MRELLRRLFRLSPRRAITTPPPYTPHPWPSYLPRRPRPHDAPLLDTPGPLIRPYLVAHEQRERRRELVLALLGQDGPGPCVIHGIEVA